MPTLPIVARKLLLVADDESNSFQALASIVKRDQSLTAKVLGLANSAYYGRRGEVRTLNNAISILGITLLKQLSLCAFVIDSWGSDGGSHKAFWQHSIAVAYAASFVAEGCEGLSEDEAFCAGLLHDIGVLVLDTGFPDEYKQVCKIMCEEELARHEAEFEVFGLDHAQAGVWLAEKWQLPDALVSGIIDHHCCPDVEGLEPSKCLIGNE